MCSGLQPVFDNKTFVLDLYQGYNFLRNVYGCPIGRKQVNGVLREDNIKILSSMWTIHPGHDILVGQYLIPNCDLHLERRWLGHVHDTSYYYEELLCEVVSEYM